MQIDNVISDENPIIFTPEDGFDKNRDLTDPNFTPFIQMLLELSTNIHDKNNQSMKIEACQMEIQEMRLEVETGTMMIIVNFIKFKVYLDRQCTKNEKGI